MMSTSGCTAAATSRSVPSPSSAAWGEATTRSSSASSSSPHAALDGDGTDRLVAAAEHPEVDIIGHPTGRRLNDRSGLEVDVERLASAAADAGTALEINANPQRLDLSGRRVQTALGQGATITINTDAHRPASYELIRYGVRTARRGWAEADDVLNARDADGIRSFVE